MPGEVQFLLDPIQMTSVNEALPDSSDRINRSSFVSYLHRVHNEFSYLSLLFN